MTTSHPGDIKPEDMPVFRVPAGEHYLPALMVVTGQAKSTAEGRRLIENRGVSFDGVKILDPKASVTVSQEHLLRAGKRSFARVLPEN